MKSGYFKRIIAEVLFMAAVLFVLSSKNIYAADSGNASMAAQVQAADTGTTNETYTPESVEQMIDALPDVSSVSDSDRQQVDEAADAYDSLSAADKVHVENASKLQNLKNVFSIKDAQGQGDTAETAATGFTASSVETAPAANTQLEFTIDDLTKSVSIILHYEYDTDGDGVNDTPDVYLTSPGGKEIKMQQGYPQIDRSDLTAQTAWNDSQMEIDIEKAQSGTWKVTSSIPVVFETSTYKAPADSITPGNTGAKTKEGEKIPVRNIAMLVCIAAVIAGFLVYAKKHDEQMKNNQYNQRKGNEDTDPEGEGESLMDLITRQAAENGIDFKEKPVVGEIRSKEVKKDDNETAVSDESMTGEDTMDFRKLQEKFNEALNNKGQDAPTQDPETEEEAEEDFETGGKEHLEAPFGRDSDENDMPLAGSVGPDSDYKEKTENPAAEISNYSQPSSQSSSDEPVSEPDIPKKRKKQFKKRSF